MRIWAAAEHAAGLRAALPADVELGHFQDAAFMVPSYGTAESLRFIASSPALRVIQTLEAGVDWLTDRVPEHVTLCNARGVRDTPVAEWVLAMLLAHGKGLFEAAERRTWKYWQPRELAGSTVLIVGHGSIGAALARRLQALDANVVGVARTPRDGVYGAEALPELLGKADSVVVLAPLTEETRGFVNGEFLARMRDGALFVNAGRGPLADTAALLDEAGRLRIALDVTDPEPLPDGHPLWRAPGVVISPHMAGDSPESFVRAYELVADQLQRFRDGQPLVNVIARPSSADR